MCTIQHSWFYPDFFAKHLGKLSSWIVVFGPCRALRGENTISKRCVQFNILDSILIFLPNIWVSYQVGLLSLGPVGPWEGRTQFLKGVYNSTFLILSWFLCQTFGWVIKLDCCLWGERAQFLKGVCTIQHSWFYPDFFAKHLGKLSSWIVVFGPCRALRGENTISKMCVQFNILDFILIFVPNIWGSYQVWLLSLGPVGPWGRRAHCLRCLYNSTFLILFVPNTWGSFWAHG